MNLSRPGFRNRGMSLIELMVVVAIVGILGAIAVPAYRNYVIRVTRTDAKRDLLAVSQRLERCFTRFNAYNNAGCDVALPYTTPEGTYTISGEVTATTYTVTATPQGGQANDAECSAFTVNQAGTQGITGNGDALACWTGRRS